MARRGQYRTRTYKLDSRAIARLVGSAHSARDRLLVLCLCCGIRTTEVVRLTASSVFSDRRGCWIKVAGGRRREVPIPDSLHELVLAYVKVEGLRAGEKLFTGHLRGRPALTRSGVSQVLTSLSGASHVSPRAFFDVWLAAMAAANVDPRLAARCAGITALTGTVARAYQNQNGPLTREEHDLVVKALPFEVR